jgi:uncharacterized membrane protein YvbJ
LSKQSIIQWSIITLRCILIYVVYGTLRWGKVPS